EIDRDEIPLRVEDHHRDAGVVVRLADRKSGSASEQFARGQRQEDEADDEFHDWIARGDRQAAIAAAAAKRDPTEHRHIVPRTNRLLAARAARGTEQGL